MAVVSTFDLTARQKAAIVVTALGAGGQDLIKELGGTEVETLAGEILQLGAVPAGVRDEVLAEFMNRLAAAQAKGESGLERATRVLEASLGKEGAGEAVRRIEWRSNESLCAFVRRDPARFASAVSNEHPQTLAFLMTQMEPELSGRVVAGLPEELQPQVAWRLATMQEISPEVASLVHQALKPLVSPEESKAEAKVEKLGGEQKAAGLLNMIPLEVQKAALESMAAQDEGLAQRVRKLMFVFRDILLLDDRAMQRVLKEVDLKDLSVALKTVEEDVRQKIFNNVSERAAVTIREEMDYMGPVKAEEIESAQDRIIERVRALEEQGEIVIQRGSTQDAVV